MTAKKTSKHPKIVEAKQQEITKHKIEMTEAELADQLDDYKKEIKSKKLPSNKEVLKKEKDTNKKTVDNFQDPELMNLLQKELGKGHTGNDKETLLTFLCACSSRLPPKDRVSEKVRGATSEGKTHMVNVCLKHFPDMWSAQGSRFTRATLEDDIEPFDLIVLLEKTVDKEIGETLKQISEDGMKTWKKDKFSNDLKDVKYIPRKSLIDTSTSNETDEEIANRAIIVHIKKDTKRYKKVIHNYEWECATLTKQKECQSWIKVGLKNHKNFDDIIIPYAPVIPINYTEARMQRDAIRFLSLIKTMAWLNQANRQQIEYDGLQLLIATPEDFWWVAYLSNEAFLNSISGMNTKFDEINDAIEDLIVDKQVTKLSESDDEINPWVKRVDVMHKVGIKSEETIKKRTEEMKNLGILEFSQVNKHATNYLRRVHSMLLKHPLMCSKWVATFQTIKNYEKELLSNCLATVSEPISNLNSNLKTTTIRYNNSTVAKINKYTFNYSGFSELVVGIRASFPKIATEISNTPKIVEKSHKYSSPLATLDLEPSDNHKSLQGKINDIKKFIDENKVKGEKVYYETLTKLFPKTFVDECENKVIIRKLPDNTYEFYGGV